MVKLFIDFEKEERWLNEMSKKGKQFVKNSFSNYKFIDSNPEEYVYKLAIIEDKNKLEELKAKGIEVVDTVSYWSYLRATEKNAFDSINTNKEIKSYYSKVACTSSIGIVLCINSLILVMNSEKLVTNNIIIGLLAITLGILGASTIKYLKKYLKLKTQN